MKLISMTDYIDSIQDNPQIDVLSADTMVNLITYKDFLKQSLELWMFVPCDENGNVLEDIIGNGMIHNYSEKVKQYEQAKDKVLFEGFEYDNKMEYWHNKHISFDEEFCENKTIEDLIQYNLTLTQTAIKQL